MKTSKADNLKVSILLRSRRYAVERADIDELARFVLMRLGVSAGELSITFVTRTTMCRLNKQYKGRSYDTDVLSFPMEGEELQHNSGTLALLGDIIISLDQTEKNAKFFETSFEHELYLYVVHGILHIFGFDDIDEKERAVMEKKQLSLLNAFINAHKQG